MIIAMADAVEAYPLKAVALACKRFNSGEVPGHNNARPPTSAELAEQARSIHYAMSPVLRERLPPPEDVIDPEERERVKAGFRNLLGQTPAMDDEQARRHLDRLRKGNAYWDARRESTAAEKSLPNEPDAE